MMKRKGEGDFCLLRNRISSETPILEKKRRGRALAFPFIGETRIAKKAVDSVKKNGLTYIQI